MDTNGETTATTEENDILGNNKQPEMAIDAESKPHETLFSDEKKAATLISTENILSSHIHAVSVDKSPIMNLDVQSGEQNELINVKANKTLADQRFQAVLSKYSSNSTVIQSGTGHSSSTTQKQQQPSIKLKIKDGSSSTLGSSKSNDNLNLIIKKTNTLADSFQVNSVNNSSNQQGVIPKLKIKPPINTGYAKPNSIDQQKIKSSSGPAVLSFSNSSKIKALNVNDDIDIEYLDEKVQREESNEKRLEAEDDLNISKEEIDIGFEESQSIKQKKRKIFTEKIYFPIKLRC